MTSPAVRLNGGPRADILTRGGAKVTAVGSAEEALATLQRERPDVLLSDLTMPGESGYWLRKQAPPLNEAQRALVEKGSLPFA